MSDDTALMSEMEMLARYAGLDIPTDRKATLLQGFKDLCQMQAQLRQPRDATHEPASTYSILSVTRGL